MHTNSQQENLKLNRADFTIFEFKNSIQSNAFHCTRLKFKLQTIPIVFIPEAKSLDQHLFLQVKIKGK